MNKTSIEWTDFSANPIKYRDENGRVVWACVHASPGCQHCYAETLAHRYGKGGPFNVPTTAAVTPFLDEREARRMLTYKPASGKRCFVGDMTDVFGPWVPDELLDRMFAVFAMRSDVTFQVLTKRAERVRDYLTAADTRDRIANVLGFQYGRSDTARAVLGERFDLDPAVSWPLPNVWLGVSCEDQQRADERIPLLRQTPSAVRFVSAEPLIAPLFGLDQWLNTGCDNRPFWTAYCPVNEQGYAVIPGLDWVIVGGESGPKARPCNIEWVRSLIAQCRDAGVPCFVKQLGSDNVSALGFGPLDGVRHRKGGDISEWPQDVRVREFPA